MLAIVVVNQSIMEWPPLQDNRLSTRPASFRNTLRQGRIAKTVVPQEAVSIASIPSNKDLPELSSCTRILATGCNAAACRHQ